MDDLRPMLDADTAPSAEQVANLAVTIYGTIDGAEALLAPPAITLDPVQLEDEEGEAQASGNPSTSLIFLIVLPGISVWGLFLVGDMAMRDILTEVRQGTLRRQLSGPVPAGQLVVGKALFTATLSLISLVLLAAIGWIVGGQNVDLAGFVVLSLALILAITGYSSVVYGGANTEQQGATISGVLLLVFAFLGGSFIQIDNLPASVQRVSPVSPFYWGTTGYQKLIRDEGGLLDVLPNAGVLALLGVALLAAGALLLQRKVRGGAA
jgi:ABC-type multidrug transport system permease subunit